MDLGSAGETSSGDAGAVESGVAVGSEAEELLELLPLLGSASPGKGNCLFESTFGMAGLGASGSVESGGLAGWLDSPGNGNCSAAEAGLLPLDGGGQFAVQAGLFLVADGLSAGFWVGAFWAAHAAVSVATVNRTRSVVLTAIMVSLPGCCLKV